MVEQSLNIVGVQIDLMWENPAVNLLAFEKKIAALKSPDVVVLPEMFATGFSMNPHKTAQTMEGDAARWMKKMATQYNTVLCGSLAIAENGGFYNRFLWVRPDGKVQYYDKRHLFSLTEEPSLFTAGIERLIVDYKGWKICPMVCYDLRFPVWSRNTYSNPYDVLIYVANWPARRAHAWQSLLIARAIENQAFVVGINRIGKDGHDIDHEGDSMIIDPLGIVLQHAPNQVQTIVVTLHKKDLDKTRDSLPFLADADSFNLEI
jgi:omega-amidase